MSQEKQPVITDQNGNPFYLAKRTKSGVNGSRSLTDTVWPRVSLRFINNIIIVYNCTIERASKVVTDMSDSELDKTCLTTNKRRRRSIHCGHCDRHVPPSTYYRHREQFFDVVSQQWQTFSPQDSDSDRPELLSETTSFVEDGNVYSEFYALHTFL